MIALLSRLPEPGEPMRVPVQIEIADANEVVEVPGRRRCARVELTAIAVEVVHEDGLGWSIYPWSRILRIEYREEDA